MAQFLNYSKGSVLFSGAEESLQLAPIRYTVTIDLVNEELGTTSYTMGVQVGKPLEPEKILETEED